MDAAVRAPAHTVPATPRVSSHVMAARRTQRLVHDSRRPGPRGKHTYPVGDYSQRPASRLRRCIRVTTAQPKNGLWNWRRTRRPRNIKIPWSQPWPRKDVSQQPARLQCQLRALDLANHRWRQRHDKKENRCDTISGPKEGPGPIPPRHPPRGNEQVQYRI